VRFVGEKEPWWVLTREEQRSLAITFVGGLGSIVVAACVIGGAVALARSVAPPHPKPADFGNLAALTAFVLVGALVTFWYLRRLRRRKGGGWRLLSWLWVVYAAFFVLFLVMLLLAWIGLAAGIH
jgi:K+-transporting ATPase A subunit